MFFSTEVSGEVARRGEVLLCKDRAIARGPTEAMAVYYNDARVFALAHGGVTGPDMADLFLAAERRIVRMAGRATGPYVVSVSETAPLPAPETSIYARRLESALIL